MYRNNLIVWLPTGCFIALVPSVGMAMTDVLTAMTALQDATGKVGAPKVQGNDLYFGDTKASSDAVDAIVKSNGGVVATIFVKSGDQFVRVATTVKKEDGSSAVGTALDANSRAPSKLKNGQPYYRDASVFGKSYDAGYESIKDASGAVIGAYFVSQNK
jgi:hypothetical protein